MPPVHRNSDSRNCGATTIVKGQKNVFVNGKLASVQGDPNSHGKGELTASVNDGTIFINNKKVVLKGSSAAPDLLYQPQGHPHGNPKSVGASPNVFASGGKGGGAGVVDEGPDPTGSQLYPDPAVQRNADGTPLPGDDDFVPETASPESQNPSQDVVEIIETGPGYNILRLRDGTIVRQEGSRNWRNNNPGNIEFGDYARSQGAIGSDGRFAIFPNYESGRAAKENLLFNTSSYEGRSIESALNRYAPPVENNTNAYINQVSTAVGVPPSASMSSLNTRQRSDMLDAMERVEGYKLGTTRTL